MFNITFLPRFSKKMLIHEQQDFINDGKHIKHVPLFDDITPELPSHHAKKKKKKIDNVHPTVHMLFFKIYKKVFVFA